MTSKSWNAFSVFFFTLLQMLLEVWLLLNFFLCSMDLRKRQRFTRNLCQAIPLSVTPHPVKPFHFGWSLRKRFPPDFILKHCPLSVVFYTFYFNDLPTEVFICCFQKSKRTKFDFWELNVTVAQVSAAVVPHSLIKVNLTRKADASLHTKLGVV